MASSRYETIGSSGVPSTTPMTRAPTIVGWALGHNFIAVTRSELWATESVRRNLEVIAEPLDESDEDVAVNERQRR